MSTYDALVDWLLGRPEPWVVFNTRTQLLGEAWEQPSVQEVYGALVNHPQVGQLLEGMSAWPQPEPMKKAYDPKDALWKVQTLADFGLRRETPAIAALAGRILRAQAEEGGFLQGGFDHTHSWDKRPYACLTHVLTYSVTAFGYLDAAETQAAYAYLQRTQRLDGGWHPNRELLPGQARQAEASCPFGTLNTLRAVAVHPTLCRSEVARRGVEYLLTLWTRRGEPYRPVGFGIGTDFHKVQYPFVQYQLLKTVDTLRRFPFARSDPRLQEMTHVLLNKRGEDGFWKAEGVNKPWAAFDFGQKKEPSAWITLLLTLCMHQVLPEELL